MIDLKTRKQAWEGGVCMDHASLRERPFQEMICFLLNPLHFALVDQKKMPWLPNWALIKIICHG